MADMSISGIASGVDWDGMMKKILEKAKRPAYVMLDKRDRLEQKKSLFEEFKIAMQKVQSTLSPLKRASTYKAKEVEIGRLDGNGSYKGVLTATVNADAEVNVHDIEVLKLAKSQVQRSNSLAGSLLSVFNGPLQGLPSAGFWISVGGKRLRVTAEATDTLSSLAGKINRTLKTQQPPVAVTASVVDDRLILKSDRTGLGTDTQRMTAQRTANAADLLDFSVDTGALASGDLTVKSKDGSKTYRIGVDFDVVGGNQLRWRDAEPVYAPAGATYQVTYEAAAGDVYTSPKFARGAGERDENVLPFTPTAPSSASLSIKDANNGVYEYGTDFTLNGKAVVWLTANRPPEGTDYEVTYNPAGGESFTLNVDRGASDTVAGSAYTDFAGGHAVIAQNGKTWEQGVDFDVMKAASGNEAVIRWRPEAGWTAPAPGSSYDLTLTKADGTTTAFPGVARADQDELTLSDWGFTTAAGSLGATAAYGGQSFGAGVFDVAGGGGASTPFTLKWTDPGTPGAANPNVPAVGDEYVVEYAAGQNTFTLSDDGNGILAALGLNLKDAEHYTAAADAELLLNGEKVTRSSNKIGADYDNELIKGMTIDLKGVGHVYLDVSHDAEAAVKGIQAFTESYNEVMKWINARSTEKALDPNKKATLNKDDFRQKWGILFGNSLLRDAKGSMRRTVSQYYDLPFTQRKSASAVYGTMEQNGLKGQDTLQVKVGARVASITVTPGDTLASIAAKINDNSVGGEAAPLHYDPDGRPYPTAFAKASVEGDKLVISAGTDRPVTISGNSALKALDMQYKYRSVSQLGITTSKADYGKSGELEFDTQAFMKAMTENVDDAAHLMTRFAEDMQGFVDRMIKAAPRDKDVTAAPQGAIVREISGIDTEVKSIDKYLAEFEKRLLKKKETLFKQFSDAERNLARLSQQASWLASVTAQLQGAGDKK